MPATLLQLRTDLRARLDETTDIGAPMGRVWLDPDLNRWLNEGLRDVARRSETLLTFYTAITVVPGMQKTPVPTNVIRIHRVEFQPTGSSQVYPIAASTYQEMDQYWGVYPQQQRSYPYYYILWGFPPNLTMQLYPVPSQGGVINIFYYRLPAAILADTDVAEIPEGWHDLVVLYAEYVARRKDRDQSWQDAKELYEASLSEMIDRTRQWHDQARTIYVGTNAVPEWLYGGSEW
jgi:hypothetical protein